MPFVFALYPPSRYEVGQVGPVFQEPFKTFVESGHRLKDLFIKDLDGKQRNEPDHRTDFHTDALVIGCVENIVEKAILLIPKVNATFVNVGNGPGDVKEVFYKLGG